VIRQAISCDICGTDKKQTNHWFVAYEHGSELRIAGWSSPHRLHTRAKHLCGQTCLHKLVDEFFARTLAASADLPSPDATRTEASVPPHSAAKTDASLTSRAAHPLPAHRLAPAPDFSADEYQSSARLIAPASPNPIVDPAPAPAFNSKTWRAEAWKREKERAQGSALTAGEKRRSIA
jgi:hypothetical protein